MTQPPRLWTLLLGLALLASPALGQDRDPRVGALRSDVRRLRSEVDRLRHRKVSAADGVGGGLALFLCGAFCALWAQNTGRGPWLWFFLGLIFNGLAVLVLLGKNSDDIRGRAGIGKEL